MNPHEDAARSRKVMALVEELDKRLRELDVEPHSPEAALVVQSFSSWGALAVVAGVKSPSEETQARVRAWYRARAEARKDAP